MKPILQIVTKSIIDTLAKPPVVAEKPVSETLEILSKVNEFYDSSWNKLLFVLSAAFAVLAIIVPIVIQYIQNKSIKASEKELENHINTTITELKITIQEEISSQFQEKLDEFEEKIEKSRKSGIAQSFHIQGNISFKNEEYYDALTDYINAAKSYSFCEDDLNLKRSLSNISVMLEKVSKEDISNLKKIDNLDLPKLLKDIEKQKTSGFADYIKEIRAKLLKLEE